MSGVVDVMAVGIDQRAVDVTVDEVVACCAGGSQLPAELDRAAVDIGAAVNGETHDRGDRPLPPGNAYRGAHLTHHRRACYSKHSLCQGFRRSMRPRRSPRTWTSPTCS